MGSDQDCSDLAKNAPLKVGIIWKYGTIMVPHLGTQGENWNKPVLPAHLLLVWPDRAENMGDVALWFGHAVTGGVWLFEGTAKSAVRTLKELKD